MGAHRITDIQPYITNGEYQLGLTDLVVDIRRSNSATLLAFQGALTTWLRRVVKGGARVVKARRLGAWLRRRDVLLGLWQNRSTGAELAHTNGG